MQIINIRNKKKWRQILAKAHDTLLKGGIIVYPTDTAYGLGGVFDSKKVARRVMRIKNRKDEKFTLIACDQKQVEKFFPLNVFQKKLARKYWPGPLSLVVTKKYAIRVPKNNFSQKLAAIAQKPIIATSANIAGQATPYNLSEIISQFQNKKNQPDIIFDAGKLRRIKTSTIVKISPSGKIDILRQGEAKIKNQISKIKTTM